MTTVLCVCVLCGLEYCCAEKTNGENQKRIAVSYVCCTACVGHCSLFGASGFGEPECLKNATVLAVENPHIIEDNVLTVNECCLCLTSHSDTVRPAAFAMEHQTLTSQCSSEGDWSFVEDASHDVGFQRYSVFLDF